MADVIQFERYKDVTGWSLTRIGEYVRKHGWKGFVLHWQTDQDTVTIERTTG